jgi:hypothetical protein
MQNLHLDLNLVALIDKPLQIGMWNLVWKQIINIPTNSEHEYDYTDTELKQWQ